VFLSRKGDNRPVTRVHAWRVLHQAFTDTDLGGKLGTHSMRKTFANKVYDALGHDLIKTQRALGHRNINSTACYLSFREEDIDRAILAI
jgi:site-specific recombinase XerD